MSGDLLTFGFALVKKESQVDANETRGKAMAGKLTKQEKSWILYDVGNSAFVLLATALIPVYFKTLAEPGSSVVVAWGYAETVASLLLALLMPVLGSLADLKGNKKKFFIGTVGTGAMFACRADLPDDLVYEIVKTVYSQEGVDYLGNVIAALKSMSPNLAVSYKPIPLHPGAERYFREIGLIKD